MTHFIIREPLDFIAICLLVAVIIWLMVRYSRARQPYERLFFENPNPMWVMDLETLRFLVVNEAATRLVGYTIEELREMPATQLLETAELGRVPNEVEDMKEGRFREKIWLLRTKEGRALQVNAYSHGTVFKGRNARMVLIIDRTETMQAEMRTQALGQELAKQNRYLESLLNSQANLAIIRLDLEGKFTYVNQAFSRRYGYMPQSLLGQHLLAVLYPDDLLNAMETLKRVAHHPNRSAFANLRMLHRSTGDVYEVEFEFVAITSEDGTVLEVQGLGHDATEKAKYMLQLSDYARQQETIMASIQDVVWSAKIRDSVMQYISPACTEMLGHTQNEFLIVPNLIESLIHPDDRATRRAAIARVIAEGRGMAEYRIQHPQKGIRYIQSRLSVVNDEQGRPHMLNGVMSDVTSLRTAEKVAYDSNRQLSEVLESITDGFFAMDKEWRFIYVNKLFEEANNVSREDLVGKVIWEVFPQLVGRRLWKEYTHAMETQETVHFEEYYDYVDRWYEITAYPNPEGLAVYFSDITQQKRYEKTILEQNRRFREIAWIQSHRVRAPLARILGLLQIFGKETDGTLRDEEVIRLLEKEARGLDATISDVVRRSHELEELEPPATQAPPEQNFPPASSV